MTGELLKRLEDYYAKQGISALDFHCSYYSFCKAGYNDFVEAKGTFVSSGYECADPHLLFISLDPGREKFYRKPKSRTLISVRKHEEIEKDIRSLPKGRHWYRTNELAHTILKRFNRYRDIQIDQARRFFAHVNTVKCCVNNPGNKKAHDRLFKNCKYFVPSEIKILDPNIIVTQGKEAANAITHCFKIFNTADFLSEASIFPELKVLSINKHPVLWIQTYHPSNYGQFNRTNYRKGDQYDKYASVAFEFVNNMCYAHKETQKSETWRDTTMRPEDVFERFAKIVKKVIGELDKFEPSRPVPWLCKNIFRKNYLQWGGYQRVFSKQENALVFGLNLEFIPAWRRVFPSLKKAEDEFALLLSQLKNMEWIWQGRPKGRMPNPPIKLFQKIWTSDVDVYRWLKELEAILNGKIVWDNKTTMRPQLQIVRLVGMPDQISDEDLIKQNIHQTKEDLQPIIELFR